MPKYTARFLGRTKGAIGIFYEIRTEVEGADPEAARLALYDRFEPFTSFGPLEVQLIPDIYQALTDAGVPVDHHESDLYALVTPESQRIIRAWMQEKGYTHGGMLSTFTSQTDGKLWYELPFMYRPFWDAVATRGAK